MTLTLSSTALALSIANRIGQTQHSLDTVSERLSSGLRLGIEDAADLSIAEKLKVDARVFTQGVRNVNEGISLANTTEVSLRELEAITLRQTELAQQAANGSTSSAQRRALDAEANALVDEYNRIVESTQYNGINTLSEDSQDVYISPAAGTEGELIQIETNQELQRTVGDGTFVNDASYVVGPAAVSQIYAGDVNNDGLDDIVSLTPGLGQFSVALGMADGSLGAATTYSGNDPFVRRPTLADYDNDGDLDIVTSENQDTLYFYENDGDGNFSYGDATILFDATALNFLNADDINGDGNVDIVGTVTADFVTQDTFDSGVAEVSELSIGSTAGGGQTELTRVDFTSGASFLDGDYFTLFTAGDATEYAFYYDVDGGVPAPVPPSGTPVLININSSDTADQVRDKTITQVTAQSGLSLDSSGSGFAIFTTDSNDTATDGSVTQSGTGLSISVTQQGAAGGGGTADISNGEYFTFSSPSTNYYAWFDIDNTGTDPAPGGTGIEIDITASDTAIQAATKAAAAIDALGDFSASSTDEVITITNAANGAAVNITVGTLSGASATVVTNGSNSEVDTAADTITLTNHGFETGDVVQLSTTGTLPAPLATLTDYYVINIDANTIQLATSAVNAGTGTQINLTTEGTGEHTITNTDTGPGISVSLGNGDGTFGSPVYSQTQSAAGGLNIGDFNGDGQTDAMVRSGATLEFLLGDGSGSFTSSQNFGAGGNLNQSLVADFDRDGYADVAVLNFTLNQLQTYQGSATGVATSGNTYAMPSNVSDLTVGDFNGDGTLDLAVASSNASPTQVSVLLGDGEGGFAQQGSELIAQQVGIAALDVNGDGATDLAVLNGTQNVDLLLANTEQDTGIAYIDLTTQDNAIESLDTLEENRLRVARELGEVGATLSRLGTTVTSLEVMRDETIGAENRVTEVDLAQEVAEMTALRIRRDAATALLGQLTVTPTLALELLQSSLA